MPYQLVHATLVDWSRDYAGPKFHAVLCDPPYGLEFMGKEWDAPWKGDIRQTFNGTLPDDRQSPFARSKVRYGGSSAYTNDVQGFKVAFQRTVQTWGEALMPHLLPGAIVLMFGGTRMWHRLAAGMEDAGFEMWDTLMWLYGQGFPKAQKIDGWEGYKTTALKPAWEPILCFKKPLNGTYAECAMAYGSGALNVNGTRIPTSTDDDGVCRARKTGSTDTVGQFGFHHEGATVHNAPGAAGRYPANLILDPESAEMLNGQSGNRKAGASVKGDEPSAPTDNCYGEYTRVPFNGFGDSGGASRFFYCAKASSKERNAGVVDENKHPTVKPIALTKYFATLLLPPAIVASRRLLVPFAGSGSEIIGALQAGWDEVVGIEQEKQYVEIAEQRLAYSVDSPDDQG